MSEDEIVKYILIAVLSFSVPASIWFVISLRTKDEKERIKREAIDWKALFDIQRMGKEFVIGIKFILKWVCIILILICLIALMIYVFKTITINPMYVIILLLVAILLKMK